MSSLSSVRQVVQRARVDVRLTAATRSPGSPDPIPFTRVVRVGQLASDQGQDEVVAGREGPVERAQTDPLCDGQLGDPPLAERRRDVPHEVP